MGAKVSALGRALWWAMAQEGAGVGVRGDAPLPVPSPCPTSLPQVEHDPTDCQCLLPAHQERDRLSCWDPPGSLLCPQPPQVSLAWGAPPGGMGWIRASMAQSLPRSQRKALESLSVPQGFTSCSQHHLQSPLRATNASNRTDSHLGPSWSRVSLGAHTQMGWAATASLTHPVLTWFFPMAPQSP